MSQLDDTEYPPLYSVEVVKNEPTIVQWAVIKNTPKTLRVRRTDNGEEATYRKVELPLHINREVALNEFIGRCRLNVEQWLNELYHQSELMDKAMSLRERIDETV